MKSLKFELFLFIILSVFSTSVIGQNRKGNYFNKIKIGFLPGLDNQDVSAFNKQRGTELSFINGIYLGPQTAVGIGIGSAAYIDPTISMYPVYADFEYYFRNKKNTPFVYSKLGYAFTITENINGGMMGGVGAGWRFKSGKNGYWGLETGYRHQQYGYDFVNAPGGSTDRLRSVSIAVNFSF